MLLNLKFELKKNVYINFLIFLNINSISNEYSFLAFNSLICPNYKKYLKIKINKRYATFEIILISDLSYLKHFTGNKQNI